MSMMGLMMEFEPPFVPTMQKKIRLNRLKMQPFVGYSAVELSKALTMIFSRFSPISKT
jgi:hypothetical protein